MEKPGSYPKPSPRTPRLLTLPVGPSSRNGTDQICPDTQGRGRGEGWGQGRSSQEEWVQS